jgi:hypothetical protein
MGAVTCKVLPGDNTALAAADPKRFYLPAYLAAKGWVALRLDLKSVDWDEAAELGNHQLPADRAQTAGRGGSLRCRLLAGGADGEQPVRFLPAHEVNGAQQPVGLAADASFLEHQYKTDSERH